MKLFINIFSLFCSTVLLFSQTYNFNTNNNNVDIILYNNLNGKYVLSDKYNPIDSSYYFRVAVDKALPKIESSNKEISFTTSYGIIRKVNYVDIAIKASAIKLIKSELKLRINLNLLKKETKLKGFDDEAFYDDFINKEQIPQLKQKLIINDLQNNSWFKSENDYLKLFTTKDAPAIILMKNIIELMPNWKSHNINDLVLYQRGKQVPIYIIDKDNIINENDTIIFMGSRAYGDTTYFENYTNKEAFFITLETNITKQRLNNIDISYKSGAITEKILIDKHIEKDLKYSTGTQFISDYFINQIEKSNHFDTRTVWGEGWFWSILTPKRNGLPNDTMPGDFLLTYQSINPLFEENEPLKIKLFYQSLQDSLNPFDLLPQRITHYDLIFDINGKKSNESKFSGYSKDSLEIDIKSSDLYVGHNLFKAIHKQMYSTTNSSLLADYFNIYGNVRAVADNGGLNFELEANQSKNIKLHNYKSNKLIVINPDNNNIGFANSDSAAFYVRMTADLTNSNFVALGINDSLISANGEAYHFFINKAPDYKEFIYYNSKTNLNEIIDIFKNLPQNSVVLVANAGKAQNNPSINQIIQNLGATADLANLNGNWIFANIYGSNTKSEIYKTDNVARLSQSFSSPIANTFSYIINLSSNSSSNSKIYTTDMLSAENVSPVIVSKTNLYNLEDSIKAIYMTHKNFYSAISKLKSYREKSQNIKVKQIDVEDIYNQFNYGNESPHAIKNYLQYYYNSNKDLPKYLTLVGDATWDPRKLTLNSISNNYVPAYGNPVSDFWYGLLDGEGDFDPEIYVGRISIKSNEEANNVVNKLIQYDTIPPSEWMKRYLFLTGGMDTGERNLFYNYIGNFYKDHITNSTYCNNYDYVRKDANTPTSSSQGSEIREKINKGNIWTIYIGHAASEIFELDGWSAFSLNNNQKYGLLSTISCNTGAFAEPNLITCRNEEYLLVPDKGFIGVMGSTTLGFVGEHNYITSEMIKLIGDTLRKERNLGEIFYYGKTKMAKNSYQLFTLYHFSLLGDPLTRFRFAKKNDPYLNQDNINITIDGATKQATDKDNIISIKGKLLNYGYNMNTYFELRCIRSYNDNMDTNSLYFKDLCSFKDFEFKFAIKDKPGTHYIEILIDPDSLLDEESRDNNTLTFKIEVYKDGVIFLDPQANWDLSRNSAKVRILNPLGNNLLYDYYFSIADDTHNLLYSANSIDNLSEFIINEDFVDWVPDLSKYELASYIISARSKSKIDGKESEFISVPINLVDNISKDKISYQLHTKENVNFENSQHLEYDTKDSVLKLKRYSIPFKTLSAGGIYDTNMVFIVRPYIDMEVGEHVFVQGFHDRGFSVGVFSSTPNGITTKYRLYDTWGKDASHPPSNWYRDSVSVDLVRFLRDSVGENDYLILGTSHGAFRLPVYFKILAENPNDGSIDSLFSVLRSYGSYIVDTLKIDHDDEHFNTSFTMIGYKGAKQGTIYEDVNVSGDSATTQGEIFLFDSNGEFTTKKIGEARQWNKLYINGKFDTDNYYLNVKVYGISTTNKVELFKEVIYTEPLDISALDASKFPFIQVECKYITKDSSVKKLIESEMLGISSITTDFVPVDELAIVKSESKIINNEQLRGEPSIIDIAVRNLSLRSNVDSVNTNLTIDNGTQLPYQYNVKFNGLKSDTKQSSQVIIQTDYLQKLNPIFINLNKEEYPKEQYYFNNNTSLELITRKDTTKPSIKLYIDNKLHQKDDYITRLPEFKIELYDNSPLQIIDSNCITVRVNGYLHPFQRTLSSKFESINNGTNLKAIFTFRPDSMQYEDISIIIYYYDAEMNRDTIYTSARTSLYNAEILDYIVYPNPAIDNIQFALKYKAPDSDAEAFIDIYDMTGTKVNSIKQKIEIGNNNINFQLKDYYNNSLSSNVYFYVVYIRSRYYVEPKYGKFIIIK